MNKKNKTNNESDEWDISNQYKTFNFIFDHIIASLEQSYENWKNGQYQKILREEYEQNLKNNENAKIKAIDKAVEKTEPAKESEILLPKGDIFDNEKFMLLILLIQDLQDGTKFSKLVCCEDSFIKLLNMIHGEKKYVLNKERDQAIDFQQLNSQNYNFYGIYGSQKTIQAYLEKKKIHVFNENMQPGIYIYQESKKKFLVICWIPDLDKKINTEFRSINTSLIRYVYELCGEFFILLSADEEKNITSEVAFNDFLGLDKRAKTVVYKDLPAEDYKIEILGESIQKNLLTEAENDEDQKFSQKFIRSDYKFKKSTFSSGNIGLQLMTYHEKKSLNENHATEYLDADKLLDYIKTLRVKNIDEKKIPIEMLLFFFFGGETTKQNFPSEYEQAKKKIIEFFWSAEQEKSKKKSLFHDRKFSKLEELILGLEIENKLSKLQELLGEFQPVENFISENVKKGKKFLIFDQSNEDAFENLREKNKKNKNICETFLKRYEKCFLKKIKEKFEGDPNFYMKIFLGLKTEVQFCQTLHSALNLIFEKIIAQEQGIYKISFKAGDIFSSGTSEADKIKVEFTLSRTDNMILNIKEFSIDQSEMLKAFKNKDVIYDMKTNNTFPADINKAFHLISLSKGCSLLIHEKERSKFTVNYFPFKEEISDSQKKVICDFEEIYYQMNENSEKNLACQENKLFFNYDEKSNQIIILNQGKQTIRLIKISENFCDCIHQKELPLNTIASGLKFLECFPYSDNRLLLFGMNDQTKKYEFYISQMDNTANSENVQNGFFPSFEGELYFIYVSKVKDVLNMIYY